MDCFHACGLAACHCNEVPLCDCGGCALHCATCDNWLDRLSAWRLRSRSAATGSGVQAELRRLVEKYDLWSQPMARLFSDLGDRRPYGEHARTDRNRVLVAGRRMGKLAARTEDCDVDGRRRLGRFTSFVTQEQVDDAAPTASMNYIASRLAEDLK